MQALERARDWPGEARFALAQAIVFAGGLQWAKTIAECIDIPAEALPSSLTAEDVSRVSSMIPVDLHSEIVCLLVLCSLGLHKQAQGKSPEAHYSATDRARVFGTAAALSIPVLRVYEAEGVIAEQLKAALEQSKTAEPDTKSALAAAAGKSQWTRRIAIGTGAALGAVALGVTGGLAAPAILALGGSALSLGAAGSVTVGLLLGLSGGGLAGYRAKRRFKDIEQFEFEKLKREGEKEEAASLSATICCAGLLLNENDYIEPFRPAFEALPLPQEAWVIKQEASFFLEQGQGIDHYLRDKLLTKAGTEVLKRTALSAAYAAVALPAAVYSSLGTLLDNSWQRSADKANKCGLILADVLESEVHGKRPVSLVGTGLGAITVFRAVRELEKRGKLETVCDVHLISFPRSPSSEDWQAVRRATSRRLTNTYSTNDWVLALVARLHSLSVNVAGLSRVDRQDVENIDASDLLEGHLNLRDRLPTILDRIGLMQ